MGPGGGPLGVHFPLQHRPQGPGDGGLHTPPPGDGDPLTHRQVGPPELSRLELGLEPLMGMGVLGHRHQPRGPPVQAVHRVEGGNEPLVPVVGHQEIGQGVPVVPLAGVDGDAPRLVHDEQVLVLIADVQGAGDGGNLVAPRRVPHVHRQDLAPPGHGGGEHRDPVQEDPSRFRPAHPGGGEAQLPPEQGLRRLSRLVRPDGQRQPAHGWASSLSLVFLKNLWYTGAGTLRAVQAPLPRRFLFCPLLGRRQSPTGGSAPNTIPQSRQGPPLPRNHRRDPGQHGPGPDKGGNPMNAIILYGSRYGTAQKYAQLL